jgi:hypothetical protein
MIFLLNQERVIREVFELVQIRIAKTLHASVESITVRVGLNERNQLVPDFRVDMDGVPATVNQDQVRLVCKAAWMGLADEMTDRLRGLLETRNGHRAQA